MTNKKGECYYLTHLMRRSRKDGCSHKDRTVDYCNHILCPLKIGCHKLRLDLHDAFTMCSECKLNNDTSSCGEYVYVDQRIIIFKDVNQKLTEF
jgi:hypothetical protein